MPLDEHYFGLGDKTGPLDRRDEAFSLWNTDAYRFQESTDPHLQKHSLLYDVSSWRRRPAFCSTTPGAPASTSAKSCPASTPSAPSTARWTTTSSTDHRQNKWLRRMRGSRERRRCRLCGRSAIQQSRYSYTSAVAGARGRKSSPRRSHPSRRHLSRHRFSGEESSFHGEHKSFSRFFTA